MAVFKLVLDLGSLIVTWIFKNLEVLLLTTVRNPNSEAQPKKKYIYMDLSQAYPSSPLLQNLARRPYSQRVREEQV